MGMCDLPEMAVFDDMKRMVSKYFKEAPVVPRKSLLTIRYDMYDRAFHVNLGVYISPCNAPGGSPCNAPGSSPCTALRANRGLFSVDALRRFNGDYRELLAKYVLDLAYLLECWLMEVDECPCDPWEVDNVWPGSNEVLDAEVWS